MTTMMNHKELMENELNLVNGGEGGLMSDEMIQRLADIINHNSLPAPIIPLPRPHELDPENGPLHVELYPYSEM